MKRPLGLALALCLSVLLCLSAVSAVVAMAGEIVVVAQRGRAFSVAALHIAKGGIIRFTNNDSFDHHVYVDTPAFKFSSAEQEPGQSTDVTFPVSGTFDVQCEIHPRMHLAVTVE